MASILKVDTIQDQDGNNIINENANVITVGASGDTVNIVGTLQNNGAAIPGDISSVVAGTGLSGGGTSGDVTLNIEAAQPTITSTGTLTNFTSTGIDDNATSTAITIDSSERVGIGTASPSEILHIEGNSPYLVISNTGENVGGIKMYDSADSGGQYFHLTYDSASSNEVSFDTGASGEYTFNVNTAEKMRIDSSGNLGIGTASPAGKLHIYNGAINVDTTSTSLFGTRYTSGSGSNNIILQKSQSDTIGTQSALANSSGIGGIITKASDGTSFINTTAIFHEVDGTVSTNSVPSRITFSTNSGSTSYSERMRINSSGDVGIGTSAPDAKLSVSEAGAAAFTVIKARNGTVAADTGGAIELSGFYKAGKIAGTNDNAGTSYAGALRFYTNSNSTNDFVQRMIIDSSGNVGIGTSSPANKFHVSGLSTLGGFQSTYSQLSFISSTNSNSYTLQVRATSSNPLSQYITDVSFTDASPDNSSAKFFQMRDSTTARVNINSDGDIYNHDGIYGTISDERIKQNIVDASSQWNDIKNIRVRKYKKKDDVLQYGEENAPLELGVISQELETVSPGLIKEDKADSSHAILHEDFTGDNPQNVKYVKYSILYMKAIKALQEAMERIETLEAKVQTLENNQP
jgi:hypothetical protein